MRKVHLRDGRSCSNPGCERRQGLHAHHIIERARGGATALYNEVLVCSTCHALLHAGLLGVKRSACGELVWTVGAREQSEDLWSRIKTLSSVPEVRVVDPSSLESTGVDSQPQVDAPLSESTRMDSQRHSERSLSESTRMDSRPPAAERFENLLAALRTLGFSTAQAKRRLEGLWESHGQRLSELSDEDIVKAALRFRAA